MSFEKKQNIRKSKIWWSEKRGEYNLGLILSGILAFLLYVLIIEFVVYERDKISAAQVEVTIFTIFLQSIGYLIMMGFANVIYYGISGSELQSKSEDLLKSRNNIYKTYFWISCSLPFLVPLILLFQYI